MFIISSGGASLTLLRNSLTKGTSSHLILTIQWIYVRGFFMSWIMPVDVEQQRAEIGNFNECLLYAVIKIKLNLFHIMTNVRQDLVLFLAILLHCISKDNAVLLFNVSCIYCVTFCLKTYTLCCLSMFQILTSHQTDPYFA